MRHACGQRHTECVWAEIVVAVRAEISCAVALRVAGHVLRLLLLLLLAAEHLLEEAELRGDSAHEGEEEEREHAHRGGWVVAVGGAVVVWVGGAIDVLRCRCVGWLSATSVN